MTNHEPTFDEWINGYNDLRLMEFFFVYLMFLNVISKDEQWLLNLIISNIAEAKGII